ncbi:hypothetical protein Cfor_10283 [Coptotermes formosanus]|uniref:Uncharacterized protein n=1 Tax=Coptotermes formosanus TaxID=36987 RepID=A0A6L2PK61_COPFO|nr:hypothetical protein Cfor_10283 [Coptotermes formosanus]
MKSVFLALVCAAVAASYPTDNSITEPPNFLLPEPNDVNDITALTDERQPEKMPEEQEEPADRQHLSSRIHARFGRTSQVYPAAELGLAGEKDIPLFRLGREGKTNDNFVRLGRSGTNNNFVRLGRSNKQDNFIRFGRGRTDNFIRLGRGRSDNFIRFGRGRHDDFIRFGRGNDENLFDFERSMKNSKDLEDTDVNSEEELFPKGNLRVECDGESDNNFVLSRRANSLARLCRGNSEITNPEERGRPKSNFIRFDSLVHKDNILRPSRSSANNDLRRGKLSDRNFIRFGRSDKHYNDNREEAGSAEAGERLGRSNKHSNNQNFIRLGKRLEARKEDEEFVRFGRDVEHLQDIRTVLTGNSTPSNIKVNTKYVRSRRSVTFSDEDETPEDSSVYPVIISKSAYDDEGTTSSTIDNSQKPFRYYSRPTSGTPNYILGPELSVLASLDNGAQVKRGKEDGHMRNYVRLG